MSEARDTIAVTQELTTAEELFHELSPATGGLWRIEDMIDPTRGNILFRGQSNGEDGQYWGLKPTAHRAADSFIPFSVGSVKPYQRTGMELRRTETRHVLNFAEVVDAHGLIVPSDSHDLRDPRLSPAGAPNGGRPWDDPTHFPPASLVAMFGLAQHHGIPTRLLDWTLKPLVAAYFAALPVARRRAPGLSPLNTECPHFSIWAVRRSVIEACRNLDPEVHFLTVPTATNANLHAQGGQFSLIQPRSDPGDDPLPTIDSVLRTHADKIWSVDDGRWQHLFPLLVEFRVPVREASTVMLTLRHLGVTAASVFPGLDGVVNSMKEIRFYQWASPPDRR